MRRWRSERRTIIEHKSDYRTLPKPRKNRGSYGQRPIMSVMFNCRDESFSGHTRPIFIRQFYPEGLMRLSATFLAAALLVIVANLHAKPDRKEDVKPEP